MLTADTVKELAREVGFDLCGVAPAEAFPELRFLDDWLERGYAGEMGYMARTARRRDDVRRVVPAARSVVALGTVYNTERRYSTEVDDPDAALISRYAWGEDYHDVLGRRMEKLLERMRSAAGEPFEARCYVDTGPVQERVYAQYAGLGWIGKNTCLIHPEKGSWLFLSEIITSLPLAADAPQLDQCGTCTLCLEACPTDAFREPWVLDATRCLSYLTIELRGPIPEERRSEVGTHVYGCDICQDVCPYNAAPARSADPAWQPVPALDNPRLADLWRQPDKSLGGLLKRSAMSRAKLPGLRRNVAVALGNSGTTESAAALAEPATPETASRAEPLVTEHIAWARRQGAPRPKSKRS
ncbi:MAG: tRNA epoxyqueuosine(34) reductase QueG [Acidobacteria bacterium]|nr:tRNA epoxyqueuosine(34) reductase QueG [Acidobacteriota bacterium]